MNKSPHFLINALYEFCIFVERSWNRRVFIIKLEKNIFSIQWKNWQSVRYHGRFNRVSPLLTFYSIYNVSECQHREQLFSFLFKIFRFHFVWNRNVLLHTFNTLFHFKLTFRYNCFCLHIKSVIWMKLVVNMSSVALL